MPNVALIILAAGNSSRLGHAKQLKVFGEKTLLEHAIDNGLASQCSPVVAILGSQFDLIKNLLENRPIEIVNNSAWVQGMGSSISVAFNHLDQMYPALSGAVVATCDQPFVNAPIIDELIAKQNQTGKGIIASEYSGIYGIPVYFARSYFRELSQLKGTEGARTVIKNHEDDVAFIDFPQGSFDIDTEADWQNFLKQVQEHTK